MRQFCIVRIDCRVSGGRGSTTIACSMLAKRWRERERYIEAESKKEIHRKKERGRDIQFDIGQF